MESSNASMKKWVREPSPDSLTHRCKVRNPVITFPILF